MVSLYGAGAGPATVGAGYGSDVPRTEALANEMARLSSRKCRNRQDSGMGSHRYDPAMYGGGIWRAIHADAGLRFRDDGSVRIGDLFYDRAGSSGDGDHQWLFELWL